MFTTILVPLDGSPEAEVALPYAVAEARAHQARLALIRVVARPEACVRGGQRGGPRPWQPDWCDERVETAVADARAYLRGLVEQHRLPPGTAIEVAVGDPVNQISRAAAARQGCLVVMTTGKRDVPPGYLRSRCFQRLSARGTVPILAVAPEPLPVAATPRLPRAAVDPAALIRLGTPAVAAVASR
jgi:nucleotide-binding universal stress UspA family protein